VVEGRQVLVELALLAKDLMVVLVFLLVLMAQVAVVLVLLV
jgi:hypothetical protein